LRRNAPIRPATSPAACAKARPLEAALDLAVLPGVAAAPDLHLVGLPLRRLRWKSAGWVLHPRLSVFVDARNLADKAYVSNAQAAIAAQPATAAYWPGDSRSVYAGVTAAF
jgi:hypothetical protein